MTTTTQEKPSTATDVSAERLKSYLERIERLEEDKKGLSDDIKDIYAQAKSDGYDVKIMRQVVKLRRMSSDDRREQEAILDTYLSALGM